jgi:hypothetical protein
MCTIPLRFTTGFGLAGAFTAATFITGVFRLAVFFLIRSFPGASFPGVVAVRGETAIAAVTTITQKFRKCKDGKPPGLLRIQKAQVI